MARVVLLLGSNVLNPWEKLDDAVSFLKRIPFSSVERISCKLWNWALKPCRGEFVNMAVLMHTLLHYRRLFLYILDIEKKMGRKTKSDGMPRPIDIDILWFEGVSVNEKDLVIPHPQIEDRWFAKELMQEVLR